MTGYLSWKDIVAKRGGLRTVQERGRIEGWVCWNGMQGRKKALPCAAATLDEMSFLSELVEHGRAGFTL